MAIQKTAIQKVVPKKKASVSKSPQAVIAQAYNLAHTLRDMLALMPDTDIVPARRAMYDVEDVLWQAMEDRR